MDFLFVIFFNFGKKHSSEHVGFYINLMNISISDFPFYCLEVTNFELDLIADVYVS